MFRCSVCQKSSERYESPTVVVIERQRVTHPEVYHRRKDRRMPGGEGTQIVREARMCASCARET